jgi:hypothetical protein
MDAIVARRMPAWRNFVWIGVVGSVLAWALAWFVTRGPTAVMLVVAIASVVLAIRGTAGMRLALVGLMVAGFAMFLAALYWTLLLVFIGGSQVSVTDWFAASVFPLLASVFVLLGSVAGFRHTTRS